MRLRGTYALISWGLWLHASIYASWLAAAWTLGRWPVAYMDDPKFIEGAWVWTVALFPIVIAAGLPAGFLLAALSLARTSTAADPIGRLRLPEWGLSVFAAAIIALIILAAMLSPDSAADRNLFRVGMTVVLCGIGAGIAAGTAYAVFVFVRPPSEARAPRTQRLLEVALGFVLIPFAYYSMQFDPIRAITWYFD